MAFSELEKAHLLQVKGVGPTVIARLEQIGFTGLKQLAQADANEIVQTISSMLSASCWKNSPQARSAINSAITAAQQYVEENH